MSARQPPGAVQIALQRCDGHFVRVAPLPGGEGVFVLQAWPPNEDGGPCLNRSELAALHAAIGELLDFYRSAP